MSGTGRAAASGVEKKAHGGDAGGTERSTETDLVEIVLATEADAEAIWRVTRAAYAPYRGRIRPVFGALRVTRRAIRFQISSGRRRYGIAKVGDAVVGVVRYRRCPRHLGISRLAVLPAYQRMGIGRRLLSWVEAEARRLGVGELRAEVRTALPEMQHFYRRQGFRPIGYRSHPEHPNYLRIMRKCLRRRTRRAGTRRRKSG